MPQIINTNVASLNAQRNLNTSQSSLATSLQRLSSGLRINSAKDDAAGLAISERFTTQIRGNDQAARNANDGISLSQTAEGDLEQIGNNLQRIRELAVQASNASNSASDRLSINNEATQLIAEIDRVAGASSFNGAKLLDGTFTAQTFQVGANNTSNDRITIASISSARSSALGVGSGSSYSTVKAGSAVAAGVLAAGDLTINGYNVGATVADGVSYVGGASSGIAKAAAINAVSGQTGVTATVSATTVGGTAATGFATAIAAGDIVINGVSIGAISAAATATERGSQVTAAINAKSSQTGVTATFDSSNGAVALTAADGRNITVGNDGRAAAIVVAAATSGLGSATTVGGAAGSVASTLAIAGTTTRSTVTLNSTGSAGITLASGGGTGIKDGDLITTVGAIAAGDISINGYSIGSVAAGGTVTLQGDNIVTAINAITAKTGVTASNAAGVVTLTSTTGGIQVFNKGSANAANTGFATGTTTVAGAGLTAGAFTAGTTAATASAGAGVSSLDLTTAAGAQSALATVDAAINTINSTRGALGAYQNRFESTVVSLQTTTENLSASRSRIRDADFAKETANLTRSQILQQAGTAMLSQANQLSQNVLSLLR
ncbi:MAG: flagellin [Methylococcaceae bacterium]|nr:flagellin [Methylococcaceae bacterium]